MDKGGRSGLASIHPGNMFCVLISRGKACHILLRVQERNTIIGVWAGQGLEELNGMQHLQWDALTWPRVTQLSAYWTQEPHGMSEIWYDPESGPCPEKGQDKKSFREKLAWIKMEEGGAQIPPANPSVLMGNIHIPKQGKSRYATLLYLSYLRSIQRATSNGGISGTGLKAGRWSGESKPFEARQPWIWALASSRLCGL